MVIFVSALIKMPKCDILMCMSLWIEITVQVQVYLKTLSFWDEIGVKNNVN